MFERFTEQARRAIVAAQEESRLRNHSTIGAEHLLLGLLHISDPAVQLLREAGLTVEPIRSELLAPPGKKKSPKHIPFTPQVKNVLELSLRESLRLGDEFVGTEHVQLGLLRDGDGVAAKALRERGLQLEEVRRAVAALDRRIRRGSHARPSEPESPLAMSEILDELAAEVARLRDLLEQHGIDPDSQRSASGPNGEPPAG